MEKTIAVIGGSGFVGRATIELIAKHSARVIVLCRNAEKAKYLKLMGVVGQINTISGDACDDETLERVIALADAGSIWSAFWRKRGARNLPHCKRNCRVGLVRWQPSTMSRVSFMSLPLAPAQPRPASIPVPRRLVRRLYFCLPEGGDPAPIDCVWRW